jgi:hypothetical protein
MGRFGQLLILYAHTFGIAHQVRGAVNTHLVACGHQYRFQRAAGGALAVGACDGNNEGSRFQNIKARRHGARTLKPHVDGFTVQVFQIRKPRGQRRRG